MSEITVFTARKIRTMNPSMPEASAVAVRDGQIIEVGTLQTMKPWLDAHPHRIDESFADHVLMPGFIDPHLHPSLGAVLLSCHFITAGLARRFAVTRPILQGLRKLTKALRIRQNR